MLKPIDVPKGYISIKEAVGRTGYTTSYFYALVKSGSLKTAKRLVDGKRVLWVLPEKWVAAHNVKEPAAVAKSANGVAALALTPTAKRRARVADERAIADFAASLTTLVRLAVRAELASAFGGDRA